jgi:hypothetical protein
MNASNQAKINKMNQGTIAEIKSYQAPPEVVKAVMQASFLLLGQEDSVRIIKPTQHYMQKKKIYGMIAGDKGVGVYQTHDWGYV